MRFSGRPRPPGKSSSGQSKPWSFSTPSTMPTNIRSLSIGWFIWASNYSNSAAYCSNSYFGYNDSMKIAIDARFYGSGHTGLGRYTTNVLKYLPNIFKITPCRSYYVMPSTTISLPARISKKSIVRFPTTPSPSSSIYPLSSSLSPQISSTPST